MTYFFILAGKSDVVHDMHAEVLAKKGFMFYLEDCIGKNQKNIFESDDISIHFYVSSAPCGNSVIKKWAKPTLGSSYENIPRNQWPPFSKQKFHYTAKHEGQGCLLQKKNNKKQDCDIISKLKFDMPKATDLWFAPNFENINHGRASCDKTNETSKDLKCKYSFTCSDKILFWQHLGLQGSNLLITGRFDQPIRLSTITVGRKFSEPHLIRALYGRYSPTKALINKGAPEVHPIVCLVTSQKFDESVFFGEETTDDASFTDPRCYWWYRVESSLSNLRCENSSACGYQEILDGKTGKIYQTNEISRINELKNKIYKDYNTLADETKTFYSNAEYKKRKKLMFTYFLSVQPEELHLLKLNSQKL